MSIPMQTDVSMMINTAVSAEAEWRNTKHKKNIDDELRIIEYAREDARREYESKLEELDRKERDLLGLK